MSLARIDTKTSPFYSIDTIWLHIWKIMVTMPCSMNDDSWVLYELTMKSCLKPHSNIKRNGNSDEKPVLKEDSDDETLIEE